MPRRVVGAEGHYATIHPEPDDSTTYWIGALATNMHDASETSEDPSQVFMSGSTTFMGAIESADGRVLSCLDSKGVAFANLWCCYELIAGAVKSHEVYTTTTTTPIAPLADEDCDEIDEPVAPIRCAVGLTDGACEADLKGGAVIAQTLRQRDFPLELLHAAFETDVLAATATAEGSKELLLNAIAGRRGAELEKPPADTCDAYTNASARIHGMFVAVAWRLLLEQGEDMEACARRLEASGLTALRLDFSDCTMQTDATLRQLILALPPTLEELCLRGLKSGQVTPDGCRAVLEGLRTRIALHNLKRLDLTSCGLAGSIPDWIGECTSLVELRLENNRLSGAIPDSIGQCAALAVVELRHNQLTGAIPESLGRCTELRELSLIRNSLTGSIPERLGQCTKLGWLSVRDNPALVPILPKPLRAREEGGTFRLDK